MKTKLSSLQFGTHGSGPRRVLVLHDWFCDRSGWDTVLPYLSGDRFTYVFADLRGYGASRELAGECTVEEAATDALALADSLGWTRYSLVGHSMSGLVVQRMVQLQPERIERMVAVAPVPPQGLEMDAAAVQYFEKAALASDEERFAALAPMWGTRLSETWIRYKLRRWRETADPEAAARYVKLWGRTGLSQKRTQLPVLIVAGTEDAPPFQPEALAESMLPLYEKGRLVTLQECGHYPMQEQPPLLATRIEEFLLAG